MTKTPRGQSKHRTVPPSENEPWFDKARKKNRKRDKLAKQAKKKNR